MTAHPPPPAGVLDTDARPPPPFPRTCAVHGAEPSGARTPPRCRPASSASHHTAGAAPITAVHRHCAHCDALAKPAPPPTPAADPEPLAAQPACSSTRHCGWVGVACGIGPVRPRAGGAKMRVSRSTSPRPGSGCCGRKETALGWETRGGEQTDGKQTASPHGDGGRGTGDGGRGTGTGEGRQGGRRGRGGRRRPARVRGGETGSETGPGDGADGVGGG